MVNISFEIPSLCSSRQLITRHTKVWTFDTDVSNHIPAVLPSQRTNMLPYRPYGWWRSSALRNSWVSVQLDIEVDSVINSVLLSNVLFVPDWNEAYLISWRMIDRLG